MRPQTNQNNVTDTVFVASLAQCRAGVSSGMVIDGQHRWESDGTTAVTAFSSEQRLQRFQNVRFHLQMFSMDGVSGQGFFGGESSHQAVCETTVSGGGVGGATRDVEHAGNALGQGFDACFEVLFVPRVVFASQQHDVVQGVVSRGTNTFVQDQERTRQQQPGGT